jgi:protoporphyrinogen oxidase
LTGLVAAHRLVSAGRQVTVLERYPKPGGLVATFEVGSETLECFYHHLFMTDADYVALASELGMATEIEWLPSRMGIYSHGRMWDFGTPASLLRFAPLPWADKARFAMTTLRLRRTTHYHKLEQVTARDWVLRHAGLRVYETVWGPLLQQKFAELAHQVAMVWLWGKVHLRGRSRSSSGLGERLGYMRGGFGRLVDELAARIRAAGGEIRLASPVFEAAPAESGGVLLRTRKASEIFEQVLFTGAPGELARVLARSGHSDYLKGLDRTSHTNALCFVLELDRQLTPYYWLNIADVAFPFGGVIEHTNYISPARYGGRRVVYLSKYLLPESPLWAMGERELWRVFLPYVQRLNPAFVESWVLARHLFRAANAQPVIPCHYPAHMPPFETPVSGLFHSCMAQIYPEDRGQNYAVRLGTQAATAMLASGRQGGSR